MIHGRGEAPAKSADSRAVAEISEYQQDCALPCGYHFFLITQKHADSSPVSNLGTIVCDNLAMNKSMQPLACIYRDSIHLAIPKAISAHWLPTLSW